jgi:threonine/homoserine/homoserine lactone efflux protein
MLYVLLAACLVSFVGSLQLGPVNLYVINTTLYYGKKLALLVALGGVMPEFIYCSLAVYANKFLLQNTYAQWSLNTLFTALMFILGILLWFKKHKPTVINNNIVLSTSTSSRYFFKGFSLALLNPQLLPFWIMVQVYFNSTELLQLKTNAHKITYILGAGLGALVLLISLIYIVTTYKNKVLILINNKYYYKVLAVVFIGIALQQSINLLHF